MKLVADPVRLTQVSSPIDSKRAKTASKSGSSSIFRLPIGRILSQNTSPTLRGRGVGPREAIEGAEWIGGRGVREEARIGRQGAESGMNSAVMPGRPDDAAKMREGFSRCERPPSEAKRRPRGREGERNARQARDDGERARSGSRRRWTPDTDRRISCDVPEPSRAVSTSCHPPAVPAVFGSQPLREPDRLPGRRRPDGARSFRLGRQIAVPRPHFPATHEPLREQTCGASHEAYPVRPTKPRWNRAAEIRKGAGQTRHTFCINGWKRDVAFPTTQSTAQRDGPGKAKERAQ